MSISIALGLRLKRNEVPYQLTGTSTVCTSMCIDQLPNILRWRLVMGFMEPQRISTTLILEADDAISSLDAQSVKVVDRFSPSPVRRLFLCGDDIIDEQCWLPRTFLYTWPCSLLTFDLHGVLVESNAYTRIVGAGLTSLSISAALPFARVEEMHSRNKVRRNALNHPGFSGSDSYNRKRSLDSAAWSRSEKRNSYGVRNIIYCCDAASQSFIYCFRWMETVTVIRNTVMVWVWCNFKYLFRLS